MHELAICQALIERAQDIALLHASYVSRVRVSVGPLSGVDPGLLERAYPLACMGTKAQGSQLAIERAPLRVRCRECGALTAASANRILCGACGEWRVDVESGDALLLLGVDLAHV